jgi:hypothetical protein
MDTDLLNSIKTYAKAVIGLTTDARDVYLDSIIKGVYTDITDKGVAVSDSLKDSIVSYIGDFVAWNYRTQGGSDTMPRTFEYRLHNLVLASMRTNNDDYKSVY